MSKSGVLDRGLKWGWGIFDVWLWKKASHSSPYGEYSASCIMVGVVHGYDTKTVPSSLNHAPPQKKRTGMILNRFENRCLGWSIKMRQTQGTSNHRNILPETW